MAAYVGFGSLRALIFVFVLFVLFVFAICVIVASERDTHALPNPTWRWARSRTVARSLCVCERVRV